MNCKYHSGKFQSLKKLSKTSPEKQYNELTEQLKTTVSNEENNCTMTAKQTSSHYKLGEKIALLKFLKQNFISFKIRIRPQLEQSLLPSENRKLEGKTKGNFDFHRKLQKFVVAAAQEI